MNDNNDKNYIEIINNENCEKYNNINDKYDKNLFPLKKLISKEKMQNDCYFLSFDLISSVLFIFL